MATTIKPVTLSGWYENEDGTVTQYAWRAGRLEADQTVPSWAEVPSREHDLARMVDEQDASAKVAAVLSDGATRSGPWARRSRD